MKKFLLFLLALLGVNTATQANTILSDAPADTTKIKRETIVIVNETASSQVVSSNENTNFIKINPLLLINGDLPIYYERGIAKGFSVEAAVGITMRNYFLDAFDEADADLGNFVETEKEYDYGTSFSINPRFYPSFKHEGYSGWYFGPMFRQQSFNSRIIKADGIKLEKEVDQKHVLTDAKLMFGYMNYIDYDRVFFEFYTGLGPRTKKVTNYMYSEYDANAQEYRVKTDNYTKKRLSLALGFKLGLAF
ncbi:MAG: hypothetical protein LPJ89_02950 [Hymenobacteraceae bacterium]|nr:hypothetical protein [Hymenobacteraceae bacterium]MDX5396511.1 hypothetical protein [Hymenobacteraceae bacterium]MDX5442723.1 hypothetical protein [Hymenobacteraceae bacterium]MDX5512578.1 hypothetical protein [Hymenobacteraceae bacterium]